MDNALLAVRTHLLSQWTQVVQDGTGHKKSVLNAPTVITLTNKIFALKCQIVAILLMRLLEVVSHATTVLV